MGFELCCCEFVLLNEITDKRLKRKDVAKTYSMAIQSGEEVNWKKVNRAIIKRWSVSGLEFIKRLAWQRFEMKFGEYAE